MIENNISSVVISGVELTPKIYNGQRVVTFRDIDAVHQRPDGTARKRFNDNKFRFLPGVDFFVSCEASEIRTLGIERPQGGYPASVTLITERGYLKLVKSFTDDLAWRVQDELIDGYFAAKQQPKPMSTAEMLLMQAQLNVDVEKRLSRVEDMQQRQAEQVQEVVGIFALPTVQREKWCEQMNRRIAAICERDGCPHQKFRGDTYRELEDAARVDLDSRLTRKKKRLKEAGEKAVVYRNITKLQIIGEDDKLRPIYEGIIRKHDAQSLSRRFPA